MATDAKTTVPRTRARATTGTKAAAKPAPAKSTTAAKPTTAAKAAPADGALTRFTFDATLDSETKSYVKFVPPKESGCVGAIYVPHGTAVVKVLVISEDDPNA